MQPGYLFLVEYQSKKELSATKKKLAGMLPATRILSISLVSSL